MTCPICRNKAVVRVDYGDETPFDLGICTCVVGAKWRAARPALAQFYGLSEDRVWLIEDLLEPADWPSGVSASTSVSDVVAAGKTKRARL